MKSFIPVLLVVLMSCSKSTMETLEKPMQTKPEVCMFGNKTFNLTTRPFIQEPDLTALKPPRGGGGGGTPPPSPTTPVILLDVNGHTVSNTSWNYSGNIVCSPANLSLADISIILQNAQTDFSPFNVIVTTDEAVYNSAPVLKRIRVVVTESWEWFGQAGGTSFIGSFTWGDNTPAFVFSSLLNYNIKYISEAVSHEVGHSLGLYHQSQYDGSCTKLNEYNYGTGTNEISWAPIMGVGYYKNLTLWHNGANTYGCSNFQNEVQTITNTVGQKTDDYGNSISTAATLSTSLNGIINTEADKDFFKIITTSSKTIFLRPTNTGAANSGGNVDLSLRVYSSNGTLLQTVSNPLTLDAAVTLPAGTYYLEAATENNANAGVYGMLGGYTISLN